ncbi:MAG TPA: tetratricopeptide repeat protein [Longimicrobiaceae bacterium]|jgi:tetratricopeptide (TPR) repeat protein|nr:tetratricopeptide repeat protein [Longimicrobiaceae bacterium]
MYVLSEFESLGLESEGLRLWQALRRVRDWHGEPPQEPDTAADNYAEVDPALRPSLAALERLLRDPEPDDATVEAVAFCCFNAAMWADERGAYRTAVGLLHAAEDVYPDNPHYAYNLGRIARKLALYDESEAWLKWAHYVARSSAKWEVATLALSGLGNLHRQRGNLPKARRFHEATRRMAKLRGLRTLEGDALYDLAIMSGDFGDHNFVVEYAREALYAYGPGHSQIYYLAHDIAWYWMDSLGDFKNASHVFSALLDHVWKPSQRLLICANLARAAAGAGWKDMFESMWLESWGVIRQSFDQEGHAAALTQLALGAGSINDWDRSSIAAREALKIGQAREEAASVHIAESILGTVNRSLITDGALQEVFKDLSRKAQKPNDLATEFAPELANAMRARRDGAPESPTRALIQQYN